MVDYAPMNGNYTGTVVKNNTIITTLKQDFRKPKKRLKRGSDQTRPTKAMLRGMAGEEGGS